MFPTWDTLMIISLEGKGLGNFNFEEAFSKWLNSRDRRTYRYIIKENNKRMKITASDTTDVPNPPQRSCSNMPIDLSTNSGK